MIGRDQTLVRSVCARFDSLPASEGAFEQTCRDKLAARLSKPPAEIDQILENLTLTASEFCALFPFDKYRRGKAIHNAAHQRRAQVVRVAPTEADIEGALAGTGDEVGILAPERTRALVLVVTVDKAVRRMKPLFHDRYLPSRLIRAVVDRIQHALGASISFGFRLDTGVALVFRFIREVDYAVLVEDAAQMLTCAKKSNNFAVRVSFTEHLSFFVPLRGRMIGPDLLPQLHDPARIPVCDPQVLLPNVDRARTVSPVTALNPVPSIVDPNLNAIIAALLTHFTRRRRAEVEAFLARLFDWIITRERAQYSLKNGIGAVEIPSQTMSLWNSNYKSIVDVATANDVIREAGGHSNGARCYTARVRCYELNRAANVRVIDRHALIRRLRSIGVGVAIVVQKLGINLRTCSRWFNDPERISADNVKLLEAAFP